MLTLARRVRHARPGEDVTLRNTRTADVAHTRDTATTAVRFGPGPSNLPAPIPVAGYAPPRPPAPATAPAPRLPPPQPPSSPPRHHHPPPSPLTRTSTF